MQMNFFPHSLVLIGFLIAPFSSVDFFIAVVIMVLFMMFYYCGIKNTEIFYFMKIIVKK